MSEDPDLTVLKDDADDLYNQNVTASSGSASDVGGGDSGGWVKPPKKQQRQGQQQKSRRKTASPLLRAIHHQASPLSCFSGDELLRRPGFGEAVGAAAGRGGINSGGVAGPDQGVGAGNNYGNGSSNVANDTTNINHNDSDDGDGDGNDDVENNTNSSVGNKSKTNSKSERREPTPLPGDRKNGVKNSTSSEAPEDCPPHLTATLDTAMNVLPLATPQPPPMMATLKDGRCGSTRDADAGSGSNGSFLLFPDGGSRDGRSFDPLIEAFCCRGRAGRGVDEMRLEARRGRGERGGRGGGHELAVMDDMHACLREQQQRREGELDGGFSQENHASGGGGRSNVARLHSTEEVGIRTSMPTVNRWVIGRRVSPPGWRDSSSISTGNGSNAGWGIVAPAPSPSPPPPPQPPLEKGNFWGSTPGRDGARSSPGGEMYALIEAPILSVGDARAVASRLFSGITSVAVGKSDVGGGDAATGASSSGDRGLVRSSRSGGSGGGGGDRGGSSAASGESNGGQPGYARSGRGRRRFLR